jgi:putative redox protein
MMSTKTRQSDGQASSQVPPSAAASISSKPYRTEIAIGSGHELLADEPERFGGTDTGPNPIELFLASLGSCKAITLRHYADRKQWPLTDAKVVATHRRVSARELDGDDAEAGKVDLIECEVTIEGDALTDEQRQRLLEIAERCPVQRMISTDTRVRCRAAD